MPEVAEKYAKNHEKIKKDIEKAINYQKENNQRYMKFTKMCFRSGLTTQDEATLQAYKKPIIEFNILNAPIARLTGEFSKQEPAIYVEPTGSVKVDEEMVGVLEEHIRHLLYDAQKRGVQYGAHRNQLAGGFGVFEVCIDYENPRSFKQEIRLTQVADPTLVYFDPMAQLVTKADAEYCGKIVPMTLEDFKAEYPDVDTDSLKFNKAKKFRWTSETQGGAIINLCEHYYYKKMKKTIVRLPKGEVMLKDVYEAAREKWDAEGRMTQFPVAVEERRTVIKRVCRYKVIGTEIIGHEETEFSQLPLVFIDNDSALLKDNDTSMMQQFTKPYVYPAEGIQRLVNFTGQVIANDFENMVMHRFKVAEESLPTEEAYLEAYKNIQMPSTLVYKAYMDQNPDKPLPPPMEIPRVGLPPEVPHIFDNGMSMLQNILGTYDAALGINDNQLSGVAIVEGATQTNAAAMPSIVNYMQALTQVGQIIINLIPKIYITPRTIPIRTKEGDTGYFDLQEHHTKFDYEEGDLGVRIEAGVSFAIAKNQALRQIIAMMEALPAFGDFVQQNGMDVVLDNMEFRGVEILRDRYRDWQEEQAENPQPSPEEMEMEIEKEKADTEAQKVANQATQAKLDAVAKIGTVLVNKKKADNDRLNTMIKMGVSLTELEAAEVRAQAEEDRARADVEIALDEIALKKSDQAHQHAVDIIELLKPEKEEKAK